MTEHSGQPNPAENLQRTLAEHSQQIHAHGSTLQTLLDRQLQTNQQLEHLASGHWRFNIHHLSETLLLLTLRGSPERWVDVAVSYSSVNWCLTGHPEPFLTMR
ncbi:hypothetical protein CHARACLAT_028480 [Characodon lateralis]|uniref:Uncharacterized protein n=1 Tax=Characodon lateralis TaxID=208331 RepID=A0ABU7E5P4_9TELE|nr:hypothetical protein [Characodon lateralis]